MQVPFADLPPTARVWIYQAARLLTAAEQAAAGPLLTQFVAEWTSHGQALRAGAEFRYDHFLVIGLDEKVAGASGCSIDASVRFVRGLEERLGVGFLEKATLAFLRDERIQLVRHTNLRAAAAAGEVQNNTLYFDNTLTDKAKFDAVWPAPAGQTWLKKYFLGQEKKLAP